MRTIYKLVKMINGETFKMARSLTGNAALVDSGLDKPPSNPLLLLQKWLEMADKLVNEPRSLVLSTVNKFNRPSSRVILLTDCDDTGILFGTSDSSAKVRDLQTNPWMAGTLWWRETIQQVNFYGIVTPLSNEKSDNMFQARPREGQAVTVIAKQSTPLLDEHKLRSEVLALIHSKEKIQRPDWWHGYHLKIESIEFWHGSPDRLHKRLRYDLTNNSWQHQYLQP